MQRERIVVPLEGLEHITIDGVERLTCPRCGAVSETWHAPARLFGELTIAIASKPRRLTPGEWRWLRRRVAERAQDVAAMLGVTVGIVSKWENGKKPIAAQPDRLIRALAVLTEQHLARALEMPLSDFDARAVVAEIDDESDAPIALRAVLGSRGWRIDGDDAPRVRARAAAA
jgi:DNA-binding transcriptional regulator YiaG